MSACEDCWDEAFRLSRIKGGQQSDHYRRLLDLPPAERPWCAFAQNIPTTPTETGDPR